MFFPDIPRYIILQNTVPGMIYLLVFDTGWLIYDTSYWMRYFYACVDHESYRKLPCGTATAVSNVKGSRLLYLFSSSTVVIGGMYSSDARHQHLN